MACNAMFDREAARLREILLGQRAVSPLLNLGSSTRAFREAPREWVAELGRTRAARRQVELAVAHAQQDLRVGSQIAELVHLVVPLPRVAEVRARWV